MHITARMEVAAIVVAVLASMGLSACGDDGGTTATAEDSVPATTAEDPSTTSSSTTSPPPTTVPPTTALPTTAAPSVPACTASDSPGLGDEGAVQVAATCLYDAWRAGDRGRAVDFADPPAVDRLFSWSFVEEWVWNGCQVDPGHTGTWLGNVCSFYEPAPGEVHGVSIEMTFVAYDDVVVVGGVETFG